MKTRAFRLGLAYACLLGADLPTVHAAPVAWYPGPTVDPPFSGAATVIFPNLGNVLIGGDAYAYYFYPLTYPLSLSVTNNFWNFLTPIYNLNITPGAVASGGMIILFGGTDGTNSTSSVIGYQPGGDPPLSLASMSVARCSLGYAPDARGRAYAIGGLDDNGKPLASAERYDPDTDTWAAIHALPTPLYNFPAVFDQSNAIYIFGGRTNSASGSEVGNVLRYSVNADAWVPVASMPLPVAGSAATMGVDGKIYVAGGVADGVTLGALQVYDPAANSWTLSTPLPEALSGSAMAADSLGRLLVMGGRDANGLDVGDVWRSQPLGQPDAAPSFTQYPTATNGGYLVPYTVSITATGNPPPIYLLLSGPAGLQVDSYSGAISWTPQADEIGSNPVTIRATNYAGFADWAFAIVVTNPPPTMLTNIAVVAVTENSVTLSWSPEDPVVGPVTYSVWLRHVLHDPRGSGSTVWYTQIGGNTTNTTLTIAGLTPGLTQTYFLAATGSGGRSPYAAVSATTLSVQAPTGLRVTGLTSTTVSLAWDSSQGPVPAASYEIWGWTDGGVTSAVYGTNITATAFTVSGLIPGTSHKWGVRARDAQGFASSFDFGPTIANPIPVSPQLGGGVFATNGGFQLTVSEGGGLLQTVVIQASTNPADPQSWVQIGSLLPTANPFVFTDTNTAQYPARFYRVIAP